MSWRPLALAVLALGFVLAPAAHAATASVDGSTLTFTAGAGEKNTVSIAHDPSLGYRITDSTAARLTGGSGCGGLDNEIDCIDSGIEVIIINLRDGDDTWSGGDIRIVPNVNGGDGDDRLSGIGSLSGGDGDDELKGADSGAQLDGGGGNDRIVGGPANDFLDGGDGDDLLVGGEGADTLLGGLGLDRIDASGDGVKTVDCQGRDDEIIQSGGTLRRQGCSGAPKAQVSASRVSVRRLLSGGLPFTVTCDRPCSVYWELQPDAKRRKLVRNAGGWLDRHTMPFDDFGFRKPVAGPQTFTARVLGSATKKALRRLKSFRVTLGVQVYARDDLSAKIFRPITIR